MDLKLKRNDKVKSSDVYLPRAWVSPAPLPTTDNNLHNSCKVFSFWCQRWELFPLEPCLPRFTSGALRGSWRTRWTDVCLTESWEETAALCGKAPPLYGGLVVSDSRKKKKKNLRITTAPPAPRFFLNISMALIRRRSLCWAGGWCVCLFKISSSPPTCATVAVSMKLTEK